MIPYLIILNHSDHTRVDHVYNQIQKHKDKQFTVLTAILPKDISACIVSNQIKIDKGRYLERKLACYLSHYMAYSYMVERKYEKAVILEDDFIFYDDHDQKIENIIREISDDFDIVRLYHHNKYSILPLPGKEFIGSQSSVAGDVGNLVSLKGAIKILSELKTINFIGIRDELPEGFIPNDIIIYKMGILRQLNSFSSIDVVVGTQGDINKNVPGVLGSTINSYTDYYMV